MRDAHKTPSVLNPPGNLTEGIEGNAACHGDADIGRLRGTPSWVRRLLVCILSLPKPPSTRKTPDAAATQRTFLGPGESVRRYRVWNSESLPFEHSLLKKIAGQACSKARWGSFHCHGSQYKQSQNTREPSRHLSMSRLPPKPLMRPKWNES